MDEKRFYRITGSGILCLGIQNDGKGRFRICIAVDVNMADTTCVSHDRNVRMIHDVAHEGVGAAGNQQIHQAFEGEQLRNLRMLCRMKETGRGQTAFQGAVIDQGKKEPVGMEAFFSALEDGTIPAFDTKRGDLNHGIGTRLENDADDTDGHGDLCKNQPLVQFALQQNSSGRIGECGE